ncbi:beta-ketoacyl-ACP synthase II [Thermotoga sp. 38H-to]|uniref:beta-ketoacyl-ACP synthase II n=1 Tax=Thermotoga sp. 38H-to TaxID=1755812 RepID=UPI0013ECA489|nr:beta-ketoacyl-ACP synthase II [Thermotoga sp. 38H-to]KAF2959722.1 3-oxoacyl-ACP synthase [Thermotoga sp. 38H-to]
MRRVVITGMGIVSPFGVGKEKNLEGLRETKVTIDRISSFDASNLPVQIAAEVRDFKPEEYINPKLVKRTDRFVHFALASTKEAVEDASINFEPYADRTATIIGSGMGGFLTLDSENNKFLSQGPGRVSPFLIPMILIDMASGVVAMEYGLKGPNFSSVSACASSLHAVALGTLLIRHGYADVAAVGGTEATIAPLPITGFANMRALSRRNDDPKRASRPFDEDRDGFVMGEGGAVLILEAEEVAKSRGAKILAEVKGVGMTDDAYHFSAPDPEGRGAAEAMKLALKESGLSVEDIDYVSCHATSTPAGDEAELKAIKKVLGEHVRNVAINSSKALIGHLLGAAGAAELVLAILQMQNSFVHGMPNLDNPIDEAKGTGLVGKEPVQMEIKNFIKNSFGFGGHNVSIVVGRYES